MSDRLGQVRGDLFGERRQEDASPVQRLAGLQCSLEEPMAVQVRRSRSEDDWR